MILHAVPRPVCRRRRVSRSPNRRSRWSEVDRLMAAGVRFGCVLADAGYGSGALFRQGLSARGLTWAVGVPRTLKVFTTGVGLLFPRANRGKPRLHAVPSETAQGRRRCAGRSALGAASLGGKAPRARLPPASRPSACDWPMDHVARVMAICRARKSGSSENGAAVENGNTISAIFLSAPRSGVWLRQSRRVGCANRDINSSSRNSVLTASKAGPAPTCAHDVHRICLSPAPAPQSGTGKKTSRSTHRRPDRRSLNYAAQSADACSHLYNIRRDVHIAGRG